MSETKMRKRDIIRQKLKQLSAKDILAAMRDTFDAGYDFFKEKLSDYGLTVYKEAGGFGIMMEIRKKFFRIDNLLRSKGEPNFESIRDTIQDLEVYATALLAMIDKGLVDIEEVRENYIMVYGEVEPIEEEEE